MKRLSKLERIELTLIDANSNEVYIKPVPTKAIFQYMGKNDLDWSMEDIGRSQKIDMIKSIIKHNPEYISKLIELKGK